MSKKTQKQFLSIIERDSEGHNAGIFTFNRNEIAYAMFYATNGLLELTLTVPHTKTGLTKEELLNKEGEFKGAYRQGVTSVTEPQRFSINEKHNVVAIVNWLEEADYTVDTYPGFKMQEEFVKVLEEAKRKKLAEMEELVQRFHVLEEREVDNLLNPDERNELKGLRKWVPGYIAEKAKSAPPSAIINPNEDVDQTAGEIIVSI